MTETTHLADVCREKGVGDEHRVLVTCELCGVRAGLLLAEMDGWELKYIFRQSPPDGVGDWEARVFSACPGCCAEGIDEQQAWLILEERELGIRRVIDHEEPF
jgi:hypothetical protein